MIVWPRNHFCAPRWVGQSRTCVQEDTLVRALRFMDTLLQRDNLQKAAFLKDLTSFWTRFDSRILCFKVSTWCSFVITLCAVPPFDVSWPCCVCLDAVLL